VNRIPLWFRIPYTLFVGVLVPVYVVQHGVANFLWFSNIALLATLAALWLGNRLLASMMAVGALLPEIGWNVLFWGRLLFGLDDLGTVAYMFDPAIPLWVRLFSLYHVALPAALLWIVLRAGYDPRAFRWQTLLAWVVLPVSFLVSEPAGNINLVYGLLDAEGRPTVAPPWPLLMVMTGLPIVVYLPTHLLLKRVASVPRATAGDSARRSRGSSDLAES
jgi:hypothetical protein